MIGEASQTSLAPPRPREFKPPAPPKRKRGARPLTVGEVQQWYTRLSAHIDHRRRVVAESAGMPRSSRRLLSVQAYSTHVVKAAAWWNGLDARQRLEALRAADTTCPGQAWAHWNIHFKPRGDDHHV